MQREYVSKVLEVEMDDAALVAATLDGNKDAFAVLAERHRPMLLSLCARMLRQSDLADDAAQEALLQALLGLKRLRRRDRFGPWLAGIGLNVARRLLRERGQQWPSWEALCGGSLVEEIPVSDAGPEELAEAADLARRVRHALNDLPRGQREAVIAFYLSGLTVWETAITLGIDVQAAKARLHKGRARLRTRLRLLWEEEFVVSVSGIVGMRVIDVRKGEAKDGPPPAVVVLEEIEGAGRRLPIYIGEQEARSMALTLEKVQVPRPLVYHFMLQSLRVVGGRLHEVRIDRLAERIFYAVAVLGGPPGQREVDARPSDALNLALLADVPIRVKEDVLQAASPESQQTLADVDAWSPIRVRG